MAQEEIDATVAALTAPETATPPAGAGAAPAGDGAAADKGAAPESGKPASEAQPAKAEGGKGDAGKSAAAQPAAPAGEPPKGDGAFGAAYDALKAELGERCGSAEQLKAQLADAHALYDICYGRQEPAALLDVLKEHYPDVYRKVAAHFAAEAGAAPADGGKGAPAAPEKKADGAKTVEERLAAVENADKDRALQQERMKIVGEFEKKVSALAKQANYSEKRTLAAIEAISSRIGRDKAMLERVERGNFADVDKLFNDLHTQFLEDVKAETDRLAASKQGRDRALPRSPAGGAAPAPQTPRKARTAEERVAEVTAQLQ